MPGSSPGETCSAAGRSPVGGIPSATAVADAQTRPPRSSTDESAGPLADEVRRGLEPGAPVDAARREQRDVLIAEEPADRLGRIAGVRVLRQKDDETAPQLVVQRREDKGQHRLGHARTRRQRCGEGLKPLLRAETLDEAVENWTVHDDGPNEAFGRVVIVRPQTSLRAPS